MLLLYIDQCRNKHIYVRGSSDQKIIDFSSPIYVVVVYLFNPYVIFNCIGYTTTIFANLCLAIFFFGISNGKYTNYYVKVVLIIIPFRMDTYKQFVFGLLRDTVILPNHFNFTFVSIN